MGSVPDTLQTPVAINRFRVLLRGWLLSLWLAGGYSTLLHAAGVTEVTATQDFLYIRGETGLNPVTIYERLPWEIGPVSLPAAGKQALSRVTAPAQFEFAIPRFSSRRDRLYSSFQCLEEPPAGPPRPLGSPVFPSRLRNLSRNTAPFPTSRSKKGLQVQILSDALELGISHAALNLNLSQLVDLQGRSGGPSWESGGQTYHFQSDYLRAMDRQVKELSDHGVIVSLILLTYESGDSAVNRLMLHPKYDPGCPNKLGAFNTVTPEGVRAFIAVLEFLADHYHQPLDPHGQVANFILGNEVNSHWFWSNRGKCSLEEFAEDYLRAVRLANSAVRKSSSSARVYLSLEHHWNIRYPGGDATQAFPGKAFLEYFHRRAREEGDFDWHVAFHPYPENLFECRTWLDRSAVPAPDSPRITFKNIDQITRFLDHPAYRYVAPTEESYASRVRRVILSEQGFHAAGQPEGELWQAAAYAYAYRKVAHNPGIDSFILHRHVDHAHEGGLNLGLWTRKGKSISEPDRPRRIYEVFKRADQPDWAEAFRFALPIIGITDWESLSTDSGAP